MGERSLAVVLIHNTLSAHGNKARKQSAYALETLSWTDLKRVAKSFVKTQTQNTHECLCPYSFCSITWQGSWWNLWIIGLFKRANELFAKQEEKIIRFVLNNAMLSAGLIMQRRRGPQQHNTTQPSTAAIRFAVARKPITAPAHHVGSYEGCRVSADTCKICGVCMDFRPAGWPAADAQAGKSPLPPCEYIAGVSTSVILLQQPHDAWHPLTGWEEEEDGGKSNRKRKSHTAWKSPQVWGEYSWEKITGEAASKTLLHIHTQGLFLYTQVKVLEVNSESSRVWRMKEDEGSWS